MTMTLVSMTLHSTKSTLEGTCAETPPSGFNDITQHEIDPGNKRSVRQPLRRQTSTGRCNKIAKLNTAGTSPCTRQKVTCSADSVSLLPSAYDDHMVSSVQSMCCRV